MESKTVNENGKGEGQDLDMLDTAGNIRQKSRMPHQSDISSGSCRDRVLKVLTMTKEDQRKANFASAAEAAFDWFIEQGARFYATPAGDPFMVFEKEVLWMDTSDRVRRRRYRSVLHEQTGMVVTDTGGPTFFEVMANLAVRRGEVREQFSWFHTDIKNYTVYLDLNNSDREIAKISPAGVEILKNGANADDILLEASDKLAPIRYLPNADPDRANSLLDELLVNRLTCSPEDRELILTWLRCFLLIDFAGTRPMARFEGPSGSGKTTASKLLSTLIYGKPQQKLSTNAANYTDGSRNPLIVLDNVESRHMTDDLSTFILTSTTGITKEKRKGGTDTPEVRCRNLARSVTLTFPFSAIYRLGGCQGGVRIREGCTWCRMVPISNP